MKKGIGESQITSSSVAATAALPPSLLQQLDRDQGAQSDDDKSLQKRKSLKYSPRHNPTFLSFSSSSSSLPVMTNESNDNTESRRDCEDETGEENDVIELSSLSNLNDENQELPPSVSTTPASQDDTSGQNDDEFVPVQRSATFGKILRSGTLIGLIYSIIIIVPLSTALRIDKNNECSRQMPPIKDWVNVQLILHYIFLVVNLAVLLIITRTNYESTKKKLYTILIAISKSLLLPLFIWAIIGSVYFTQLKEINCENDVPYIYGVSQFIIGVVYFLVGCFLVFLVCCCGFFILRISFLAYFFGSNNENDENLTEDNNSISKDALEALPVVEFKESGIGEDDASCGICLCLYEDDDNVTLLPCGHHFHTDCIHSWLTRNKTCPYCKHPADKEVSQEIIEAKVKDVETIKV